MFLCLALLPIPASLLASAQPAVQFYLPEESWLEMPSSATGLLVSPSIAGFLSVAESLRPLSQMQHIHLVPFHQASFSKPLSSYLIEGVASAAIQYSVSNTSLDIPWNRTMSSLLCLGNLPLSTQVHSKTANPLAREC